MAEGLLAADVDVAFGSTPVVTDVGFADELELTGGLISTVADFWTFSVDGVPVTIANLLDELAFKLDGGLFSAGVNCLFAF